MLAILLSSKRIAIRVPCRDLSLILETEGLGPYGRLVTTECIPIRRHSQAGCVHRDHLVMVSKTNTVKISRSRIDRGSQILVRRSALKKDAAHVGQVSALNAGHFWLEG